MSVIALIVAAGRGSRMVADYDIPKQYLPLGNKTVLRRSVEAFVNHPEIDNVLVVIHPSDEDLYKESVAGLDILPPVLGGATRQESVRRGLEFLAQISPQKILIHDVARPFVDKKTISAVVNELDYSRAVLPAVLIEDTIKKCDNAKVLWTVDRSELWRAQTPQGFIYSEILANHQMYKHMSFTDDCAIAEHANIPVTIVVGSQNNFKITTDSDYDRAEQLIASMSNNVSLDYRVGIGYDIHRFTNERSANGSITLGCVVVPHEFKIDAHSDGDCVSHAVIDSILGALNKGDIGTHFPNTDEKYKNASSIVFFEKIKALLKMSSAKIKNIDINIITEKPKISPYRDLISAGIAENLEIDKSLVCVKGKTKEGLDSVGSGNAIEVQAVCMLEVKSIA
ncbi:2-C-methyl-D-erythritol 4-phosphate cytidylyltransferase [Candidatus Deianiraea vastatrix]|uniref:Bifunctional enzyme IspD/IspF n=1 Tax=Candidatus Deianiraea vastatrix TaxID=2163644 RepID=A0A5B8XEV2_9RICK|nr:2-C-methyl-D-erythritol 4-phosphate cytidylyltransferase [Candidatus Deianiraea vastatrix]QED23812.1 Bifunctional enzyme IspD/IspF [Candidatus Deianiraea vastatrix]